MEPSRPWITKREVIILVFLAGVVILAICSIRVPVFGTIAKKSTLNKSLQHAKQIALALRSYAGDYNGKFPTGTNANEVFAKIVPDCDSEKIFYVETSAWHGTGRFRDGPDDRWEATHPPGIALEPGENAYAYNVSPLHDGVIDGTIPLIASAFSDQIGTYSDDPTARGGVWKGRNCVVIYTDGRGETPRLDRDQRFMRDGENVFAKGERIHMVNPAPPMD